MIMAQIPPRYMQITKVVPGDFNSSADGEGSEGIEDASLDVVEEAEDVMLSPRWRLHIADHVQNVVYSTAGSGTGIKVKYSVSYSQTYQVPVLYFQIEGFGEMNKLQFIYDHLVPGTRSKELQSVGVMGAISQTVCC